jgi:hypothetical protein
MFCKRGVRRASWLEFLSFPIQTSEGIPYMLTEIFRGSPQFAQTHNRIDLKLAQDRFPPHALHYYHPVTRRCMLMSASLKNKQRYKQKWICRNPDVVFKSRSISISFRTFKLKFVLAFFHFLRKRLSDEVTFLALSVCPIFNGSIDRSVLMKFDRP